MLSNLAHATAPANTRPADLEDAIHDLGKTAYLDALPGLRDLAGHDEQIIRDLNAAYAEAKKDSAGKAGVITVDDVLAKYKQNNETPGPEQALLGTVCVIAIVGVYGAGYAYIRSNPRLWSAVQSAGSGGSNCKDRIGQVINSAKQNARAAAAQAGGAST